MYNTTKLVPTCKSRFTHIIHRFRLGTAFSTTTAPTIPWLIDVEFSQASCYQCYNLFRKKLGNSSYWVLGNIQLGLNLHMQYGPEQVHLHMWNHISILFVTVKGQIFCRKPQKFAFPNFVRHRFPQHGLLVSNAIWWSEHKKLYLLRLTCRGILRKWINLLTETPS